MGLSAKDIRIFYDNRSRSYIIANDYKMRRLMDKGYSIRDAKKLSHGHINKESQAEKIKENILTGKRPKSRKIYILKCYVRVCDETYRHYDWVEGLYITKKNKTKQQYYNVPVKSAW